ncbi:MAG TPA: hypothetical protein VFE53_10125 [Mucilaginibacter sp.]|nr:hypothetical protein [Mucilaginibacter sp.]
MKRYSWLLLLMCVGCVHRHKTSAVHIRLINNKLSIEFFEPDPSVMGEINRDSGTWQNIFPVYRMPLDTDMKDFQRPQPGSYSLSGDAVIFTPDTPFIRGQTYFLRCYQFGEGKGTWDIIKHKQKLGSQPYTDLTFKK